MTKKPIVLAIESIYGVFSVPLAAAWCHPKPLFVKWTTVKIKSDRA